MYAQVIADQSEGHVGDVKFGGGPAHGPTTIFPACKASLKPQATSSGKGRILLAAAATTTIGPSAPAAKALAPWAQLLGWGSIPTLPFVLAAKAAGIAEVQRVTALWGVLGAAACALSVLRTMPMLKGLVLAACGCPAASVVSYLQPAAGGVAEGGRAWKGSKCRYMRGAHHRPSGRIGKAVAMTGWPEGVAMTGWPEGVRQLVLWSQ